MEQGVFTPRYRINLDDLPLPGRSVILGELAERSLFLAHLRQQATLDDDLRLRWDPHIVGFAFYDR